MDGFSREYDEVDDVRMIPKVVTERVDLPDGSYTYRHRHTRGADDGFERGGEAQE